MHEAFQIPYVYDYITKSCRQQAEVIQNHENENVRYIEQSEARHTKYKRLKLGGGCVRLFQCLDCCASVSCTEPGLKEALYILYIHPLTVSNTDNVNILCKYLMYILTYYRLILIKY
jgi:hypothetical protein